MMTSNPFAAADEANSEPSSVTMGGHHVDFRFDPKGAQRFHAGFQDREI
jgi:hypothetical protein